MKATENIAQKFQTDIEATQIRTIMEQGFFLFLAGFVFTCVVVFTLWNHVSHPLLLLWFAILNTISFVRWLGYRHYQKHLNTIHPVYL